MTKTTDMDNAKNNQDAGRNSSAMARIKERQEWREGVLLSNYIALQILDALDLKGWSQKKLAEEMNVQPQQVSKWVKGQEDFRISTVKRLEKALGINLDTSDKSIQKLCNHLSVKFHLSGDATTVNYSIPYGTMKTKEQHLKEVALLVETRFTADVYDSGNDDVYVVSSDLFAIMNN